MMRSMTLMRTEEKEEDDEKEKHGQEKGCRCLQSFALRFGQFQVPSPINFPFYCGGGWGPETGLTARRNSVGQRHARRRPRRRTTPRRRKRRTIPRKRMATTEEEDGDDEKERRRSFGPLYRCNVGIAFDCLTITHCPLTAANTSDLQLKGLGTAHESGAAASPLINRAPVTTYKVW